MQTEFNSRLWWDFRNGQSAILNSDPALYGWRTGWFPNEVFGSNTLQFYSDGGIVYGQGYVTNRYPAFYAGKLLARFAAGGDTVVTASTDYPLLATYAVKRTNGSLSLLVINKSSYASLNAAIALSGYAPFPDATIYSYGIPQDEAARTNGAVVSQDLSTNSLSSAATNFTLTFSPYSATVLRLAPARPQLVVLPSPSGQFIYQLQGQAGVPYSIQSSEDLATWTSVSTNTLSGTTLNLTNSAVGAGTFHRAAWAP